MKTKNLLFFSIAFFCFTLVSNAQKGVRIGYIDMEYILESVPEYQEASIQLEGKVQRWKQDLEQKQKEVDQMKLNLSNERVLLTKELIEEREEEIKIKETEIFKYQQDRFGPQGDLMIQKRQLVQPIQDQVFNIVQEIATNKKYDFIFDKSADVVMLFAAERNDLSDEVIRSIERAGRRVEAVNKKDKREIERLEALSEKESGAISEREQAVIEKKQERELAVEEKKTEREMIMLKRQMERDSIKAAKQAEFEARRQQILDQRQQRKDSILNARQQRNPAGNKPDPQEGDGNGDNGEE